jgi:hypothetical protein
MGGIITKSKKNVVSNDIESHETSKTSPPMSDMDLQECKKKIENDAYIKVMKMNKHSIPIEKVHETLIDIMNAGADEFKEKTGRHMTYSEMREMYG